MGEIKDQIPKWKERIAVILAAFVMPGILIFLWAFGLLAMQLAYWYRTGEWIEVPAVALFFHGKLEYFKDIERMLPDLTSLEFSQWLIAPSSALGPHKIVWGFLNWIGLPFFLFISGFLYIWITFSIACSIEKQLD